MPRAITLDLKKSIHLNGKVFPLVLHVRSDKNKYYYGHIPIPDDYPRTLLANVIKDKTYDDDPLAFGRFTISFNSPSFEGFYNSYVPWTRNDEPEIGHLSGFYISMNEFGVKHLALPEEVKAMVGLGKTMLCAFLQYAVSKSLIQNLDNSYLMLEADGGKAVKEDVVKYSSMSEEQLMNLLFEKYPVALFNWLKAYIEYDEKEDLPDFISRVDQNAKLIQYYERAYGMKLFQKSPSDAAKMGTSYITLIQHCQKPEPEPLTKPVEHQRGGSQYKPFYYI